MGKLDALSFQPTQGKHAYAVPAVEKSIRILEYLEVSDRPLRLSELSDALDIPKTTVFRILYTLREAGFVEQDSDRGCFFLGPRILSMANRVKSKLSLVKNAIPYMEKLVRITGETCKLGVFSNNELIVLHKVESQRELGARTDIAGRFPLHAGAGSKVIMAYLPNDVVEHVIGRGLQRYTATTITDENQLHAELRLIREQGFAEDNEECIGGIKAVACPIRDDQGRVIAALSIPYLTTKTPGNYAQQLLPPLKKCAQVISNSLGYKE